MRLTEVLVPDRLWRDRTLSVGAQLLWCYMKSAGQQHNQRQEQLVFQFKELRSALRISQNSLVKYLRQLDERNWIRYRKVGLRKVEVQVINIGKVAAVALPPDLLLDFNVPRRAVWLWCAIRRHQKRPMNYGRLKELTGYSQPTISKYLAVLRQRGWLRCREYRVQRFVQFDAKVSNPWQVKREADLAQIDKVLAAAKKREGYSLGQCIMTLIARLCVSKEQIIENAEIADLKNPVTGGQMHWDALFPGARVAMEFHGAQHFGPTELYDDQKEFEARRIRDLIKLGLAAEQSITVVVVRPEDLSFARISELLHGLVPLEKDLSDQWHLVDYLERVAKRYRSKVPSSAVAYPSRP